MKNDIENIDKIIREALTEEQTKFYDELEEQNVFEMLGGVFQGKNKWIIYLMNIMTLVFFVGFVYSLIQFFDTEITNELIKWGVGIGASLLSISLMKLFVWMQMDKNAILRELKRLELQLSLLNGKKDK